MTSSVYAQPSNDDCSGATPLTVGTLNMCTKTTVSFDGTETDSSAPSPGCAGGLASRDLWYSLKIPASGAVTIETHADSPLLPTSIDDGAMAAYTGDCNNLVLYDCNDDGNGLFEKIIVVGTEGDDVFIRLWHQDGVGTPGTHTICAFASTPPPVATNDDCDTAIELVLNVACSPIIGTNVGATSSSALIAADPSCAFYNGDDVWFKVVIPNDQDYDVAIETYEDDLSITDGGMAVYTEDTPGDCLQGLTEIECDDDGGIITNEAFERIELTARRNETLYVRIWTYDNAQTGTFNICATSPEALSVSKDDFVKFKIYPNPASDILNLKFNQDLATSNIDINVFDVQGKLVLNTSKSIRNSKVRLNVSYLKTGLYFLKINNGINSVTQKIAIK